MLLLLIPGTERPPTRTLFLAAGGAGLGPLAAQANTILALGAQVPAPLTLAGQVNSSVAVAAAANTSFGLGASP
jgi:hypothetical protein